MTTRRKSNNEFLAVIDGGRSLVKGKTQTGEHSFPHALVPLTDTEYRQIIAREGHEEVMKINGTAYAIGKTAMKRGYQPRQTTAERYNDTYYGTLVAAMLFNLYEKPINDILLYASHPPIAVEYRADIVEAAKGKWVIECNGMTRRYEIARVHCFDEPVGGVMNLLIAQDGKKYQRSDIKEGATLVLDIGGQTIDIAPLDNGRVDYTAIDSRDGGIIEVENRFTQLLRAEHREKLKSANFLPPEKIREALRTGAYDAGAYGTIPCSDLVKQATDDIILRIKDIVDTYGGIVNYNNIVLTGGGGGLLFNRIAEYFNHSEIIAELGRDYFHLADQTNDVHLANVRGGYKLLKMFQAAGKI